MPRSIMGGLVLGVALSLAAPALAGPRHRGHHRYRHYPRYRPYPYYRWGYPRSRVMIYGSTTTGYVYDPSRAPEYGEFDLDADGQLSQAELGQLVQDHTASERRPETSITRRADRLRVRVSRVLDSNGDGRVFPDEQAAGAVAILEGLDVNADGQLARFEFEALHRDLSWLRQATREVLGRTPPGAAPVLLTPAPGSGGGAARPLSGKGRSRYDVDGDGRVTEEDLRRYRSGERASG